LKSTTWTGQFTQTNSETAGLFQKLHTVQLEKTSSMQKKQTKMRWLSAYG